MDTENTKMNSEINSEQYLSLLNKPEVWGKLKKGICLNVAGCVTLPEGTAKLPAVQTRFEDLDATQSILENFDGAANSANFTGVKSLKYISSESSFGDLFAGGTSLVEFNTGVNGVAVFTGVKTLKNFGPKAYFGELNAVGTSIRKLNCEVVGDANLSEVKTLTCIGEKAKVGGNLDAMGSGLVQFLGTVKGDACLKDCTSLKEIGSKACIGGNLVAHATGLEFFDARVGGVAHLEGNPKLIIGSLASVAGGLYADPLVLSKCPRFPLIPDLPDDMFDR